MACKSVQVKRGDTWNAVFRYRDADDMPIDLTGATAILKLKPQDSNTAALTASTATGEITIDEGAGVVTLSVPYATMAGVTPAVYRSDLEITIGAERFSTETFMVEVIEDITV